MPIAAPATSPAVMPSVAPPVADVSAETVTEKEQEARAPSPVVPVRSAFQERYNSVTAEKLIITVSTNFNKSLNNL